MSDGDGDRILTDLNRRWRRAYYKNGKTLRTTLLKNLLIRFLFYPVFVCTFIHFHLNLLLFSVSLFFWSFVYESKKQRRISIYAHQFLKSVKYTPPIPPPPLGTVFNQKGTVRLYSLIIIRLWKTPLIIESVMCPWEGTPDFKWEGLSNGGKNKNLTKSLGLQTESKKKSPDQNLTLKISEP